MNVLVQTCIVIGVFWGNRALLVGIVRAVMIEGDIVSVQVMPYRFSGRAQFAEVSPGVFLVDLPTPQAIGSTNSFIFKADGIHDNGRSLIVDTGCNNPLTKETFDKALACLDISWDSVDVFITHFHWDHCAGLDQIWQPGMTVYAGIDSVSKHGTPVMVAEEIGAIERNTSAFFDVNDSYDPIYWQPMTINGEKDIPLTVVHEEQSISVGNYVLEVLETPGHDLHHVCLLDKQAKLLVAGDQVLYSQNPPIMMESIEEDQLGIMLDTLKRLSFLDVDLVLCGHGQEGHDLSARCYKVLDHYRRQLDSFKKICLDDPECSDIGKISYLSTHSGKRTYWEDRLIFGRRALLAQNMAYAKHLVAIGELPDIYEIVPLR